MYIPDKVKIDGMEYQVIQTDETLTNDNKVCRGIIEYEHRIIKLNTLCQDEQGMKRTLFHEIIHGIVRERNFDFKADEEMVIDELAKGFYNLLNDNPEMFSGKAEAKPYDYCEYSFPKVELNYSYIIADISSQCGIKDRSVWLSENDSLEDVKEKYEINYCNKCGRKIKLIEPSKEIKDKMDELRDSIKRNNEKTSKSDN